MRKFRRIFHPTDFSRASGAAFAEALALARENRAELLLGRTGLAKFFLGSVAERVIPLAPCPVLTVRGK